MGKLASEVHRDLTGERDRPGAHLGLEIRELDAKEVADPPLDLVDGDDLLFVAPELAENLLSKLHGHLAAGERAERDHARERSLQLTNVGLDPARDEIGD